MNLGESHYLRYSATLTNRAEAVKSRRYDNPRRQSRVRATRAEIAAVAQRLFIERGYPATTIEAIAETSDTPIATVYRLFGSKRGILSHVAAIPLCGAPPPTPFAAPPPLHPPPPPA